MHVSVRVPSLSNPAVSYTVEKRGRDLVWRCDCPRSGFLKAGDKDKHVALVERAERLIVRCSEAHGLTEPPRLCLSCLVEIMALMAGKVTREFVTKASAKEKVSAARKRRTRKPKKEKV